LLPLTLKWAREARLTLPAALGRITTAPLRVLGLAGGPITVGQTADFCIFDPEAWWKVEACMLQSQGKNTPLIGMEVQGRVRYTLVEGAVVFEATV
jgi:dihydroorotase